MRGDWPSNENSVQIEKANGDRFDWMHSDPNPENRPTIESYGSKFMEGFSEAVVSLARKEAVGPDLGKYDTLRIFDAYGVVVYEGRVVGFEEDTDAQRVTVTAAGWMTHGRDRPMLPVLYVDKDQTHFTGPGQRRRDYLVANNAPAQNDPEALPDSEGGALRLVVRDQWEAPVIPRCEAFYDAGAGQKVARIFGRFEGDGNTAFELVVFVAEDDDGDAKTGADLYTAASGTIEQDFETPLRYAFISWRYNATPAGNEGSEFRCSITDLAVYGDHELPRYGPEPAGLLASDIIIHSAGRFVPLLDTSEVEQSAHIVDQCVEGEQQDPYDFWLKLNKYERRHLAVWEKRRLYFTELHPDVVDWRVREGDDGVSVRWTGPSIEAECNGIVVQFQSVETGRSEIVTPEDDDRLADLNPALAANEHGIPAWESITLPNPDSREGAVRYGQLTLAELNRRKQAGTIIVRGAIRDVARHWHPVGHPRAGQTVLVEDISGSPRLITEAKVTEPETLTLTVDGKSETTDAILDELLTEAKLRSKV